MLPYTDAGLQVEDRVNDLIARMTIEEKVGQLNQRLYGFDIYSFDEDGNIILSDEFKEEVDKYSGLGTLYGLYRADPWSKRNYSDGIYGERIAKAYNTVQKYVMDHSRLHIPMMLSSECPHGHQALDGSVLPVNLAAGATFNPELFGKACAEVAKEVKGEHVDLALVSCLDICRDPRWGRSEECYGEDPFHASCFAGAAAAAYEQNGVGFTAKHFCAQGEGTGGVNASAARIGDRELHEIHLPAMKACAKAKASSVMAAYNEIDGMPCHANKTLLTDILRNEIGFDGFVMSDGIAIDRLEVLTEDPCEMAALALNAGVDTGLWDNAFGHLAEAYEKGLVTMDRIDEAVKRVLRFKFKQGLFEKPFIEEKIDENEARDYSSMLAKEALVLLKNDNALPLSKETIALVGNNADNFYAMLGDYTPPFRKEEQVSIKDYFEKNRSIRYAKGCYRNHTSEEMLAEAEAAAHGADVCICVIGGSSSRFDAGSLFDSNGAVISFDDEMDCGEGVDLADISIPSAQIELLRRVKKQAKKIVTVIIGGRAYAAAEVLELSDALIYGFYPGPYTAGALYGVMFGYDEPSGRLPVSLPVSAAAVPCYYNYRESYNGMKYSDSEGVLFPFGYGLGYATIEYDNVRISYSNADKLRVSFDIVNKSARAAFSVPQVYIHRRGAGYVPRVRELVGFTKVRVDDTEKVCIEIDPDDLNLRECSSFDVILSDGSEIYSERIINGGK